MKDYKSALVLSLLVSAVLAAVEVPTPEVVAGDEKLNFFIDVGGNGTSEEFSIKAISIGQDFLNTSRPIKTTPAAVQVAMAPTEDMGDSTEYTAQNISLTAMTTRIIEDPTLVIAEITDKVASSDESKITADSVKKTIPTPSPVKGGPPTAPTRETQSRVIPRPQLNETTGAERQGEVIDFHSLAKVAAIFPYMVEAIKPDTIPNITRTENLTVLKTTKADESVVNPKKQLKYGKKSYKDNGVSKNFLMMKSEQDSNFYAFTCESATDQLLIHDPGFEDYILERAVADHNTMMFNLLSSPFPLSEPRAEIRGPLFITTGCADCLATSVSCMAEQCLDQCQDFETDDCYKCFQSQCEAPLKGCAGDFDTTMLFARRRATAAIAK